MMNDSIPWVLKYQPKIVDDMVLAEDISTIFKNVVKSGKLNNISLFGHPGVGKTTLAKILVDQLDCEYILQP